MWTLLASLVSVHIKGVLLYWLGAQHEDNRRKDNCSLQFPVEPQITDVISWN